MAETKTGNKRSEAWKQPTGRRNSVEYYLRKYHPCITSYIQAPLRTRQTIMEQKVPGYKRTGSEKNQERSQDRRTLKCYSVWETTRRRWQNTSQSMTKWTNVNSESPMAITDHPSTRAHLGSTKRLSRQWRTVEEHQRTIRPTHGSAEWSIWVGE